LRKFLQLLALHPCPCASRSEGTMGRSPSPRLLLATSRLLIKRGAHPNLSGESWSFSRFRHFWSQARLLTSPAVTEVSVRSSSLDIPLEDTMDGENVTDGPTGGPTGGPPQTPSSERQQFEGVFPGLVEDVVQALDTLGTEDVAQRFKQVCVYNVPHGKLNRGLLVVDAFTAFAHSSLGSGQLHHGAEWKTKAAILGWCVEWLQASLLVLDDVMDASPMRRGRPSWHAQPDVGIVAVNDGLFLENCVFVLLEKHFSHLPSYASLVGLFRSILMKTIFGQSIDMTSSWDSSLDRTPSELVDLLTTAFTHQRYAAICLNKTALYTFVLPVLAGLRLAEVADSQLETRLSEILQKLGLLFQSQDDYLDCYGDPNVIGKIGTDIQEGKCTWLLVETITRADEETKKQLVSSYGRNEPDAVAAVKEIYTRLGMPSVFESYETKLLRELESDISELGNFGFSTAFLRDLLRKMEKRQK